VRTCATLDCGPGKEAVRAVPAAHGIDEEQTATTDDAERLSGQRAQVEALMSDGAWHTLPGLAAELRKRFGRRYAETSISARLRDLRHKGWRIDRERTRPKSGLYQYRAMKVSA
jgi:hypothetical protein